MPVKRIFNILIVSALVLSIAAIALLYSRQPKIAYVQSELLIEKYEGTIVARTEFNKTKNRLISNVDSLKLNFDLEKRKYQAIAIRLSSTERKSREEFLGQLNNQLLQYAQVIEQKINEEDNRMMQEVLNQINSFVKQYAIEKKFDIILGTTRSGNILFGEESLDITDAVIADLNKKYKGI